ncbi:MAG: hypothetical protein HY719_01160 [Planctomycetes bacterium]|nr:hypothetical protein [Planctomycetota bacterium]
MVRTILAQVAGGWRVLAIAVFAVGLLASCGNPAALEAVGSALKSDASALVTPSAGGVATVNDPNSPVNGNQVVAPAGAVSQPTVVTVSATTDQASAVPALPSQLVGVGQPMELGPTGTVFEKPVNVTMTYTDADLAAASVTSETSLQMVTYTAGSAVYEYLSVVSRDVDRNTVTAQTTHFSYFRLAAAKPSNPNSPSAATVSTPTAIQTGDVIIAFTLSDPDMDAIAVRAEFRATTSGAAWTKATISGQTSNLPPGAGHAVTWNTLVDLPGKSGTYYFKLIPNDGKVEGVAGITGSITLNNTNATTSSGGWSASVAATAPNATAANTFPAGSSLIASLTIVNQASETRTISYSSGQRYDFTFTNSAGAVVRTWSKGMAFPQVVTQDKFGPGASQTATETLTLKDDAGVDLPSGTYQLGASVPGTPSAGALPAINPVTFSVTGTPPNTSGQWSARFTASDQSGQTATTFTAGAKITLSLALTNNTGVTQTVTFTSATTETYTVTDVSGVAVRTIAGAAIGAQSVTTVAAGNTTSFAAVTWDQTDNQGNQVAAGQYLLSAAVNGNSSPTALPSPGAISITIGSSTGTGTVDVKFDLKDAAGASQSVFAAGDKITFELVATNNSTTTASLVFPSSQQFDFSVQTRSCLSCGLPVLLIWQWSYGKAFTQAFTSVTLAPGQSKTFSAVWDQTDNTRMPVGGGDYSASGQLTVSPTSSSHAVTQPKGKDFTITSGSNTTGQVTATLSLTDAAGAAKSAFALAEPVTMTIRLTNGTGKTVTYVTNSGQKYDFSVTSPPGPPGSMIPIRLYWTWSQGRMFTQALTSTPIAAGQTVTFTETWDQKQNDGTAVGAGTYVATGSLVGSIQEGNQITGLAPAQFTIGSTGGATGDTTPPAFSGIRSAGPYTGPLAVVANSIGWDAATDNKDAQSGITYNIYQYSVDPRVMYFAQPRMNWSTPVAKVAGVTGQATYTWMDANIQTGANIVYYYAVRAMDSSGNEDQNTKELSVTVP